MARISESRLNHRATIQRRAVQTNTRGVARSEFVAVAALTRVAAAYREISLREIALGNGVQSGVEAEARIRDCAAARTITVADRIVVFGIGISGVGFDIVGVGLPNPDTGEIRLQLRRVRG